MLTPFTRMSPMAMFGFGGEVVLGVLLAVALVMAFKHMGKNHHWLMLGIFGTDLVLFKTIMYLQAFDGRFGPFPFNANLVLPHMLISWLWILAGAFAIATGFRFVTRRKGKMFMPPKGRSHIVFGWAALSMWYLSLLAGLGVFVLTYV